MKVIYFSSAYYPVISIAAAVQCGILPAEKSLTRGHIKIMLQIWEKLKKNNLLFLGKDSVGNYIYLMHYNCEPGLAKRLIETFLAVYNVGPEEYKIIVLEEEKGFRVKLGRFFEKIGLKTVETFLAQNYAQKYYPQMVELATGLQ